MSTSAGWTPSTRPGPPGRARDGGVILALGDDRAETERIAASDPFATHEVCAYRITLATKTSDARAPYRQRLPQDSRPPR